MSLLRFSKSLHQYANLSKNILTRNFNNMKIAQGGAHHDSHAHDKHDHGHHDDHHGHDEPHVPKFYDKLGKFCLLTCYLWIFHRLREDKGQLFGLYKPWEHEHEHSHLEYQLSDDHGAAPTLAEHEEEEEEEEEH